MRSSRPAVWRRWWAADGVRSREEDVKMLGFLDGFGRVSDRFYRF